MNKYDLLVYIGRFQPFHSGHRRVVDLALEQSRELLILVGSPYQARTCKNPFTVDERRDMIQGSLDPAEISRTTVLPLRDHLYNENKWIAEVQTAVETVIERMIFKMDFLNRSTIKVGIIGYEKDESSYYLNSFPQWDYVDVGRNYIETIDASTIRSLWLSKQSPLLFQGAVSNYTFNFMTKHFGKSEFTRLCREYTYVDDYLKQWANTPYPVIFNTVDAVLVQSGHVLLVHRKSAPGEGLLAMPGGYVNKAETIQNAMIRELREETKIKVPDPVLRGNVKAQKVFDAPGRDLRGRIITHAFLIELPAGKLPPVKGGDDAKKASWIPISELEKMEDQMYGDHHHIVSYFLGRV